MSSLVLVYQQPGGFRDFNPPPAVKAGIPDISTWPARIGRKSSKSVLTSNLLGFSIKNANSMIFLSSSLLLSFVNDEVNFSADNLSYV